jgi:hypothetical protein
MQKCRIKNSGRICSSLVMVLALLWLTVSTPFVYESQQQFAKEASCKSGVEKDNNPFANTTEEKTENGPNTLSEYLHDMQPQIDYVSTPDKCGKCHPSDLYYAFHPELISPPPEA